MAATRLEHQPTLAFPHTRIQVLRYAMVEDSYIRPDSVAGRGRASGRTAGIWRVPQLQGHGSRAWNKNQVGRLGFMVQFISDHESITLH